MWWLVFHPCAKAPKLVTDEMVKQMRPGSCHHWCCCWPRWLSRQLTVWQRTMNLSMKIRCSAAANIPGAGVLYFSTIALTTSLSLYRSSGWQKDSTQAIAEDEGYVKVWPSRLRPASQFTKVSKITRQSTNLLNNNQSLTEKSSSIWIRSFAILSLPSFHF